MTAVGIVELVLFDVWLAGWALIRVFAWARRNVNRAVDRALDEPLPPTWVNDGARRPRRQVCRTTRHDYREECDA